MQFQKTQREAYLNFLRSKYERQKGEIFVTPTPYYILIDPTSICQLPAVPDRHRKREPPEGDEISPRDRTMLEEDLFFNLIEEVGDNLFFIMFYNWGEPLLNKKLPAYVRKATSYQITIEIPIFRCPSLINSC